MLKILDKEIFRYFLNEYLGSAVPILENLFLSRPVFNRTLFLHFYEKKREENCEP